MGVRKSGANLHLEAIGETYDATYAGTIDVIATQQVPITFDLPADPKPHEDGIVSIPCWQVLIQADPSNDNNVLIGDEAHGCYIVLRPGETITIPINDVKKVFARSEAGGGVNTINWLAMT